MEKLIEKWAKRWSEYIANAEKCYNDGDRCGACRSEGCARQWRDAINELRESIKEREKNVVQV